MHETAGNADLHQAVTTLLTDDEYRHLQVALLLRPEQGVLIPRSGGPRKLRWTAEGRGKRGGARVIYYWAREEGSLYMLYIYSKNAQADLTPSQVRILGALVREEFS